MKKKAARGGGAPSAAAQARLSALGADVRRLIDQQSFKDALVAAQAALRMVPGNANVLGDIALCHMRLGRLAEARTAYEAAHAANPRDENILDGLAECCGRANDAAAARRYGTRALALKEAQVADLPAWPLPASTAPAFDARAAGRNVIAYTLFGANPRYCEGALLNVLAARAHYPAWRCRFYLDGSVPAHVQRRLADAGAELVVMDTHADREIHPLMWRFLVLDDPSVDRFLVRDADSLVSAREAAAVEAWLASGAWFHLMRDYATHSELLLAGMWGGCSGVVRELSANLLAFTRSPSWHAGRVIDQQWLRRYVWPTAKHSVLAHDTFFAHGPRADFPPHPPVTDQGEGFHVGANMGQLSVEAPSTAPDGTIVTWCVKDRQGVELFRYPSTVKGGKWSAVLPRAYADAMLSGAWRCELVPSS